jgi:cytochrome c5
MSTTVSMWLGTAFLLLAIVAVLLQAWLWSPRFWNETTKKTEAPRAWLRVHAACGYTYGIIYVVMMWEMFPRLWEYQYELPARTVIHATVAIFLGVLLFCKIAILVFFRHFEEAMPRYGFAILASTVVLISLSLPHAARALDLQGRIADPENMARLETVLQEVDFGEIEVGVAELATEESLARGRDILVNKCVTCHDMRTILIQPRTGQRWLEVVTRMKDKPDPFATEPLTDEEIPVVTAYLIAITPDIQQSTKRKREGERERSEMQEKTQQVLAAMPATAPAEAPALDEVAAKAALEHRCTDCHELDEIDGHGGDDVAGWSKVIADMVAEGAEVGDDEAKLLAAYLAQLHPKK